MHRLAQQVRKLFRYEHLASVRVVHRIEYVPLLGEFRVQVPETPETRFRVSHRTAQIRADHEQIHLLWSSPVSSEYRQFADCIILRVYRWENVRTRTIMVFAIRQHV